MDYDSMIDTLVDSGYLPHFILRRGIRRQLAQRLHSIATTDLATAYETKMKYVRPTIQTLSGTLEPSKLARLNGDRSTACCVLETLLTASELCRYVELLRTRPIAVETGKANEQHYEVGTDVLQAMLGPRMKYSACLYPKGGETLGEAEVAMLHSYVEKAELKDGMRIFDMGCGWGSLSLYLAEVLPNSHITAFSNSTTQKQHIDSEAKRKGLPNLEVVTGDIATYEFSNTPLAEQFDRVLSIEMFEHMKNYQLLLTKIATLLKPKGKLFVHLFAHRSTPYDFDAGWMTEHFFTGGTMPSADLLLYFQDDLQVKRQWWVSGRHYARTCEDWLANMCTAKGKQQVLKGLASTYGEGEKWRWFYRWQVFYLACAELFAWEGGEEWGVCHYLFEKQ